MIFAKKIITTILLLFALVHITNAEDKDSLLISKLKRKADSLNAEFAKNTYDKKYYSLKQGRANYFRLKGSKVPDVEKDIANGISFEDLVKKYSEASHIEDMFVFVNNFIHPEYSNYSYVVENLFDYDTAERLLISNKYFQDSLKAGNYAYFKYKNKRDSDSAISVLHFTTDVASKILPNKYKTYIDYTSLFLQPNENTSHFYETQFIKSINNFLYQIYDSINKNGTNLKTRMEILDSLLRNDKKFTTEFNNIIDTALNKRISTYSLEDIVENLISKEIAFKLKYSRKVYSFCGNDPSGWEHKNDLRRLELLLGDYVFFEYYLNNYFYNCDYNSLEYIFQNNLSKLLLASELYFNNNNNSNNQTFSFNLKEYKNKIIPLYLEDYNNNLFKNMLIENILDTDLDDYNRIGYFKLLIGTFKIRYDDKLTQLEQNKLTELISKLPKYYNLTQLIK